jgi:hypothetical protein
MGQVIGVLVLVLGAGMVQAEEAAPRSYLGELAVQLPAVSLDIASTEYALGSGMKEGNPLGRTLVGRVGVKTVRTVGVSAIVWKLERRGQKGWARVVRWGVPVLEVAVASLNTRNGWVRRQRKAGQP